MPAWWSGSPAPADGAELRGYDLTARHGPLRPAAPTPRATPRRAVLRQGTGCPGARDPAADAARRRHPCRAASRCRSSTARRSSLADIARLQRFPWLPLAEGSQVTKPSSPPSFGPQRRVHRGRPGFATASGLNGSRYNRLAMTLFAISSPCPAPAAVNTILAGPRRRGPPAWPKPSTSGCQCVSSTAGPARCLARDPRTVRSRRCWPKPAAPAGRLDGLRLGPPRRRMADVVAAIERVVALPA